MKKLLLTSLMMLFTIMFAGCAEDSKDNNTNTPTPPQAPEHIQSGDPIDLGDLTQYKGMTPPIQITLTNPRNVKAYPVLINTAMGLNGRKINAAAPDGNTYILQGVSYFTYLNSTPFHNGERDSKLTYSDKNKPDLSNQTPLEANKEGNYYIMIEEWYEKIPTVKQGELVIAFVTKEESDKYFSDNSKIILLNRDNPNEQHFLSEDIVNELNKIDDGNALRKYEVK